MQLNTAKAYGGKVVSGDHRRDIDETAQHLSSRVND